MSYEQAVELADSLGYEYVEVSAKNSTGVEKAFLSIAYTILNNSAIMERIIPKPKHNVDLRFVLQTPSEFARLCRNISVSAPSLQLISSNQLSISWRISSFSYMLSKAIYQVQLASEGILWYNWTTISTSNYEKTSIVIPFDVTSRTIRVRVRASSTHIYHSRVWSSWSETSSLSAEHVSVKRGRSKNVECRDFWSNDTAHCEVCEIMLLMMLSCSQSLI